MLSGDSRGAIDRKILDDARVVSFWDPQRISGTWFGNHAVAGLGGRGYVVWDAYYAFRRAASWHTPEPRGAVAAGSDIIGNTDALSRFFIPLLGTS
jgi:hypothetical protein